MWESSPEYVEHFWSQDKFLQVRSCSRGSSVKSRMDMVGSTERGVFYLRFELETTRLSTALYIWMRQRVSIYGDK